KFFFFQAEDGIRDWSVTGVQTCALPILEAGLLADQDDVDAPRQLLVDLQKLPDLAVLPVGGLRAGVLQRQAVLVDPLVCRLQGRSEERRVGKEWRARRPAVPLRGDEEQT